MEGVVVDRVIRDASIIPNHASHRNSLEVVPCKPGGVEELVGVGGFGLEASLGEEYGAVNPRKKVQAVLDHEDCAAGVLLGEAADALHDIPRCPGREAGRRFV